MPRVTAMTETVRTATGRRAQCRSPWLAKSGSSSMAAMASTGTTSMTGVSIEGGRKARTE